MRLSAHFAAMQDQARAYIESTGTYQDLSGKRWTEGPSTDQAFISDMIEMLDGHGERIAKAADADDRRDAVARATALALLPNNKDVGAMLLSADDGAKEVHRHLRGVALLAYAFADAMEAAR